MITEQEILNLGVQIGCLAKTEVIGPRGDKAEKHQLENLISSLDYVESEENSLPFAAVFAVRQAKRGYLGRKTAQKIATAIQYLRGKNAGKREARKMLSFAKWVFEVLENIQLEDSEIKQLNSIEKLVEIVSAKLCGQTKTTET